MIVILLSKVFITATVEELFSLRDVLFDMSKKKYKVNKLNLKESVYDLPDSLFFMRACTKRSVFDFRFVIKDESVICCRISKSKMMLFVSIFFGSPPLAP